MRIVILGVTAFVVAGCLQPSVRDGCSSSSDCAAGLTCSAGTCRAPVCASDSDCGEGLTCDATARACVRAGADAGVQECDADGGCPGTACCRQGVCACTCDTWSADIEPLLAQRCGGCHGWTGVYREVKAKALGVRPRVEDGAMPPNGGLPETERGRIVRWLDCGLPQ